MKLEYRINKIKELLIKGNNLKCSSRTFKVFGYQFNYYTECFGDLNAYYFNKHEVIDRLVSLDMDNRPGTIKEKTLYVCVHDTASAAETAGSLAHANYVCNGGGGTSWHYSCGDDAIYHHIPDNEVAYHAGDGLKVSYYTIDTGVLATTKVPCIEIIDGYFYLNGIKSLIKVPDLTIVNVDGTLYYSSCGVIQTKVKDQSLTVGEVKLNLSTKDINDAGINTLIINGNYHFTPIYYNKSYGYVANRLGNLYSIGIETMVNKGSNLLVTWHKCAKLVAHLLKDNNLTLDAVKPHHFFSGKPCPMTLRYNNMWNYFLSMVEIEYEMLKYLSDDIEIILNVDKLNNGGVLLEEVNEVVSYEIIIKTKEFEEKFILN
ncbi:MAG: N-acetylmuramoyl-L-alanine amidase [Bacilli bacterium]|nr:N-acetylmuramoyl-L-alanine amidase [Bacilli bacterium]